MPQFVLALAPFAEVILPLFRKCLLYLDFCSIFVGILLYIPNFYSFLACRVVQGGCAGAFSSIVPLIIKEISPLEISGMMGNFPQMGLGFGVFFG
jgi:MFS family permease